MLVQPYQLHIERTDASKNMARFYAMDISTTLFGQASLTRRWGRIGTAGRAMVHHFDREEDAVLHFLHLLRKKRARGYRTRPKGGAREPMLIYGGEATGSRASAQCAGRSGVLGHGDGKATLRREAPG